MADGWRCPSCSLVLAPHVTEHRCDPAAQRIERVLGYGTITSTPPSTVTITSTTGHLGLAGGYLAAVPDTDGMPPRPEITEGAA